MGTTPFWLIATLMVAATAATLVVPMFWRDAAAATPMTPARRRLWALAIAVGVPLAALASYHWLGRPELLATSPVPGQADTVAAHARAAATAEPGTAGDLQQAIERLRARLATQPDDSAGWELLAQSYEFQGLTAAAAEARRHVLPAATAAATAPVSRANPPRRPADADVTRLIQSAQDHRRRREFTAAVDDFAALEARGALDADLWADYADALGGAQGRLDARAVACIDAALRLDPAHAKALWLRATWQTQQQDFAAAIPTWQRLLAALPADSPDARIITANLEEARQRAGAARGAAASPAATTVALRGHVRVDPALLSKIARDDVLFVLARAADERGPPLAVWRTRAGPWPLSFTLDDSHAMMAGRKLSDFRRVVLEARISHSGDALPQPGDLRATSDVLDPRQAGAQQLTISEIVGGG